MQVSATVPRLRPSMIGIVLVLVYFLIYLLPLNLRPLTLPDETRYAEIPYEMLISGDWVTPRLNGIRYFEKPVLGYWLNATSIAALGKSNFAVRLVSALAAGATAMLIYFFSFRFFASRQISALSALIYLTLLGVYMIGTYATLDTLLTLFLTGGIMGYALAALEPHPRRAALYWASSGIALGLAFLTKGFLALAVPVLVLLPWLVWQRHWRVLWVKGWLVVIIATLVILPWGLMIHQHQNDFWHYFFWVEHIKRFTADNAQHKEPFYFFLVYLPLLAFPWISLLPAAIAGQRTQREPENQTINRLLWLWILLPFVFFSMSSGKLATYILPCLPPLALVLGSGLHSYFRARGNRRLFRVGVIINMLTIAIIVCLLIYAQYYNVNIELYGTDETTAWLLVIGLLLIALGSGFLAVRPSLRNIGLGLMPLFLLPFIVLVTVAIPNRVLHLKSPESLIAQSRPLIGSDWAVVSEGSMFPAVNWYLDRRDIYLLGPGEVGYGLNYPDAAHRLVTKNDIADMIRNRSRRPVALFCRKGCPKEILALVPAGSTTRAFGIFSYFLIR